MTPKTAEIISRTAAWRDRGISKEAAIATLGAQYHFQSLQNAARTLGASEGHLPQVIVESVYERKTRR